MRYKRGYGYAKLLLCIAVCCALLWVSVLSGTRVSAAISGAFAAASGLATDTKRVASAQKENFGENGGASGGTLYFTGFGSGKNNDIKTEAPADSEDVEAIAAAAQEMYSLLTSDGDISEFAYTQTSANSVYGSVAVNNKTSSHSAEIKSLLASELELDELKTGEPTVLIYHTHATEGYELLDMGWYSDDYNSRTKDTSRNVVRVGTELAQTLREAGINVLHDTTIHDSSYSGAYDRSAQTVTSYLDEYPSIILTIDVHRDAIHYDDGTKAKPTAVINGKKAAQVMIIAGCEDGSVTDFPNWRDNLMFSLKLQREAQEMFSGIMRPVFFCERKYNMDMTRYSMLLEVGTDANTLGEAVYSGRLIGEALASMLKSEAGI